MKKVAGALNKVLSVAVSAALALSLTPTGAFAQTGEQDCDALDI